MLLKFIDQCQFDYYWTANKNTRQENNKKTKIDGSEAAFR